MLCARPARQSQHCPARVHIPVGRTKSGKRRNNVHAAAVGQLFGEVLAVIRLVDEVQLIAQPLNDRPRHEHGALQSVLGRIAEAGRRDRSQQTVGGRDALASGVCQQETACSVCVLPFPRPEASLPEQRRLLIACDAADGQSCPHQVGVTVDLTAGTHLGQDAGGDIQNMQQLLVPATAPDVVQHGARGIGRIGHMDAPTGQLPDQPAVHRAEQQFARLGARPHAGDMIQHPLDLGAAEVGIGAQTCHRTDVLPMPGALQLLAQPRRATALPDDGITDRTSACPLPQDRGLALVGDADPRNLLR